MKNLKTILIAALLVLSTASAQACDADCIAYQQEQEATPAIVWNYQLYKEGTISANTAISETLADYGFYELATLVSEL